MRFHPKRISGNTNYISGQLSFNDFRRVIDQLFPVDKRGAKNEPFISEVTGSGVAWDTFMYKKVRLRIKPVSRFTPMFGKTENRMYFQGN